MTDYKKMRRIITTTAATLAAGVLLWVGVQKYQKYSSEKAFENLPKAQQELVIKLRENKTPEKTIQVNIDAYNRMIWITNNFNEMVTLTIEMDAKKLTTEDEKSIRIFRKQQDIGLLIMWLKEAKTLKQQMILLDTTKIDELIASMESLKAQLELDIKGLKALKFK